ncbi:MAG: hypothetical protein ABSG70_04675 [Terriglobales bacterium]
MLPASLLCLSCGSSSSPSTHTSGIPYRAFLSNNVSAGTASAGIYIVNAQTDVRYIGTPISAGNTPGMMAVTPNRAQTVVFSGSNTQGADNQFSMINNATESNAAHVALPGYTESFVISLDSSTAYVAVPNAPEVNQSQGAIEIISVVAGSLVNVVEIPSVHYLSLSNGGNRLLAFTDVPASLGGGCDSTPASLFVVTPSEVGIENCPAIPIPGFDQPLQAYFSSDDSTAYVVNCGVECGGNQASVQTLDMTTSPPTPGPSTVVCGPGGAPPCIGTANVPAATEALVVGSTMYLAGTPYANGVPSQPCTGEVTAATTCGLLTILDLGTMTVTSSPIVVTDGYHNRIAMGANGQLFIGSRTCTEIIPPQPPPQGAETRGCLSIYNTLSTAVGSVPASGVVIPPANGDVTGLQSVATRIVVYVVQGGSLSIYDTTVDSLEYNPNNPNHPGQIFGLVGNFFDVKTVDF